MRAALVQSYVYKTLQDVASDCDGMVQSFATTRGRPSFLGEELKRFDCSNRGTFLSVNGLARWSSHEKSQQRFCQLFKQEGIPDYKALPENPLVKSIVSEILSLHVSYWSRNPSLYLRMSLLRFRTTIVWFVSWGLRLLDERGRCHNTF